MADVIDAALATAGTPCQLGTDPAKYLEKFEDWYEHTSLLADAIGITSDAQKLRLLMLWGGKDFRQMVKDANVITTGDVKDTLPQALVKIRTRCGSHVNLTMGMYKLMHIKQGSKPFTTFRREVEELAVQCQFDQHQCTKERAIKDAIIFGKSDEKLRKEALAKDVDQEALTKAAHGYEQSRKSYGAMMKTSEEVRKVKKSYTQEEVDNIVAKVTAGKYSNRSKDKRTEKKQKCPNCPPHYKAHEISKCPAKGKECAACKKPNHFARSSACQLTVVKAVNAEEEEEYQYDSDESVSRVEVIEIKRMKTKDTNNIVNIKISGEDTKLFVDSGSKKTLLPLRMYTPEMGELEETQTMFRPYGTKQHLPVVGKITTTLTTISGAKVEAEVYVIDAPGIEPLLGDIDAKELGILIINKEGRNAESEESEEPEEDQVAAITNDLRRAGIEVNTRREREEEVPVEEKQRISSIVEKNKDVFQDYSGLLKDDSAIFHVDPTVPPVATPYRPVPLAVREKLSQHLEKLRQ